MKVTMISLKENYRPYSFSFVILKTKYEIIVVVVFVVSSTNNT